MPLRGHADDRVLPRADRRRPPASRRSTRFCSPFRSTRAACATVIPTRRLRALIEETERVASGSRPPRSRCSARSARGARAGAAHRVRSVLSRRAGGARDGRPHARRPRRGECVAARRRGEPGITTAATARSTRRTGSAAGRARGLADVHGRAARTLERGAHRGGDLRADRARALHARGRGRDHPRTRRPSSCAVASGSRRPRASARPRRRPCAARPRSPPATPRSG